MGFTIGRAVCDSIHLLTIRTSDVREGIIPRPTKKGAKPMAPHPFYPSFYVDQNLYLACTPTVRFSRRPTTSAENVLV